MPKQVILTALGNRIEYATTNGKGLITGNREDITDDCVRAVFEHMMREHKSRNKGEETLGYSFGKEFGELHYHPPKTNE